MSPDWTIKGDYVEACNCNVACQCIWLEPPDDEVCTVSLAWHIRDGQYGGVDLSGLSAALLVSTEEGVMFAPETGWDVVLLIDDTATDEQRTALEAIYLGRAGGIFAPVADTHYETIEVATAPITFSRDAAEISVDIGDAVSLDVAGIAGFNEEVGTISPHPLTKSHTMQTAKSDTATVAYNEAFAWDVSGHNSFLGDFELANA